MSFYIFQLCGVAYLCSGSIIKNSSVFVDESLCKTRACLRTHARACVCLFLTVHVNPNPNRSEALYYNRLTFSYF